MLVDTAGLRPTRDLVEEIGVGRARAEGERADVLLYVFDATAGFSDEDRAALDLAGGRPRVLVGNKADRLPARPPALPAGAALLCGLSAEAGEALRGLLAEAVLRGVDTDGASEMLASMRQADLVERAAGSTRATLEALGRGESPEYAAAHCHAALDALADLVGETTSDDVLDRLFATFCIGK
jgi:tRNA modification GTPase